MNSITPNQTAIITGGSHSLGAVICEKLLSQGVTVYSLDIANNLNPAVHHLTCDLRSVDQVKACIAKILAQTKKVDIFIANAARYALAAIKDMSSETLEETFATNVFGHVYCLQTLLPHFHRQKYGRIILMGSEQIALGRKYSSAYAMTKAALAQFAKNVAAEIADDEDITINVLCPGAILETGMMQQAIAFFAERWQLSEAETLARFRAESSRHKPITKDTVADWILWLAHPQQRLLQGENIRLDLGFGHLRP